MDASLRSLAGCRRRWPFAAVASQYSTKGRLRRRSRQRKDSLWFHDLPKSQVNPFANIQFGFRNRMLPMLLHRSSHDDKRSVACEECLSFSGDFVPNAEPSCCS